MEQSLVEVLEEEELAAVRRRSEEQAERRHAAAASATHHQRHLVRMHRQKVRPTLGLNSNQVSLSRPVKSCPVQSFTVKSSPVKSYPVRSYPFKSHQPICFTPNTSVMKFYSLCDFIKIFCCCFFSSLTKIDQLTQNSTKHTSTLYGT